jgi:excisionase family DNA binding protein
MRKKHELTDSSLLTQGLNNYDERLLRIDEVAEWLGLTVGSLYHLVSQRRIPVVRISSRCVRFSRRALLDWIENHSQDVNEESLRP